MLLSEGAERTQTVALACEEAHPAQTQHAVGGGESVTGETVADALEALRAQRLVVGHWADG